MSSLTKELLQRNDQSMYKEIGIKFDSIAHYFYFSKFVAVTGDPFGVSAVIPVGHINDAIKSNADKMLNISIVDSQVVRNTTTVNFVFYIRFPELEPQTRYHYFLGDGLNNFNQRADITLPCANFPDRYLKIDYGYTIWSNDGATASEQTQQNPFSDVNKQPFPDFEVDYVNVRFKVQTITLD